MYSVETIIDLSNEAAELAAVEGLTPYVPWNEDEIQGWAKFPFPNLGSHRPDGWELIDNLFCDSSGLGAENEPALTFDGLKAALIERVPHSYGYGIIEVGQFQVVLGVFEKVR